MSFLADESIDKQIVDRLRQQGHSIWYVAEMEPGISDDHVLRLANREQTLLLTADKDFGELIFRQRQLTAGVILIRLAGLPPLHETSIVSAAIEQHATELIAAFSVITGGTIRIRRQGK